MTVQPVRETRKYRSPASIVLYILRKETDTTYLHFAVYHVKIKFIRIPV